MLQRCNIHRSFTYARVFIQQLGCLYMWTYTYHLIQSSSVIYRATLPAAVVPPKEANKDLEASSETTLLRHASDGGIADNTNRHTVSPPLFV